MADTAAGAYADECVAAVRDDPTGRLDLLRRLYEVPRPYDLGYLPYLRAATAFMGWQLRRGLLNPVEGPSPGSPWWRTLNEALLRDTCEARALAFGRPGEPRTPGVAATLAFIRTPTATAWYRAHNLTIATAYLDNEDRAAREGQVERFFINLVLVRVLYAHALVAHPRLALAWLAPAGRLVGDPRLSMTGIFLSLSRVLPDRYPLEGDLDDYVDAEHSIGHLLDVGIIVPRLDALFEWSSRALGLPALDRLLSRPASVPAYAWDPKEALVWQTQPSRVARLARRALPATPR